MVQTIKNLLAIAMQDIWVQSLGQEDPLEKGLATLSSILAWRIPWTEEPGRYSPWGSKELDTTERLTLSLTFMGRKSIRRVGEAGKSLNGGQWIFLKCEI